MKKMMKVEMVKKLAGLSEIIQTVINRMKELKLPYRLYPSSSEIWNETVDFVKLPEEERKSAVEEFKKLGKEVAERLKQNNLDPWTIQEFERYASELKYATNRYNRHSQFEYGVRFRVSLQTSINILNSLGFEINTKGG